MIFKKLSLQILSVVLLLFCVVSVNAKTIDNLDISSNGVLSISGRIKISGANFVEEAESGLLNEFPPKATIIILNPGYEESDIENIGMDDASKAINHISAVTTDIDGTYSYSTKIQGESGEYTVVVSSRFVQVPYKLKFQYVNKVLEDLNNIKNSKDVSELKTFIEEENSALKLDMSGYMQLKKNGKEDSVIQKIKDSDDFSNFTELNELFSSYVKVAMFETIDDADTLYKYVNKEYSDYPIIEFINENCSDEIKLNIISEFLHTEIDDDSFIKNLSDKTLVNYLKGTQYWKEIQIVFDSDAFDFPKDSLSLYKKLKNSDVVLKEIHEAAQKIETFDDVKRLFVNSVEKYYNYEKENKNDTGSSSRSGSSSSKKGSITVSENPIQINPTPDVNSENDELFKDLDQAVWAKTIIEELAKSGIVNGVSEKYFEPNSMIKREEFIQMCMNGLRLTGVGQSVDFDDVNENDWFYSSVAAAYNNKIINGYENKLFGVGTNITRQDAAVVLYRCAEAKNILLPVVNGLRFTDEYEISDYAAKSIDALSSAGIINGMPDGSFMPLKSLTRAEGAKLIYTFLKYGKLLQSVSDI